jgi:hypothetical protein
MTTELIHLNVPPDPDEMALEEMAATEAMMASMSERIADLVVAKLLEATTTTTTTE